MRRLQQGEVLGLPQSRPMPTVGGQCHELRINDRTQTLRIMYFVALDAIVILEVFRKKTETTPKAVIETCRQRLAAYRRAASETK